MTRLAGSRPGMSRRSLLKAAAAAGLLAPASALSSCAYPANTTIVRSDIARSAPQANPYTTALTPFSTRLFDQVSADTGNCVVSPFSVAAVLAMIRNGAVGAAATELDAVLGAPIALLNAELNSTLQALDALNTGTSGVKAMAANSLWGQQDLTWQRPFLDTLAANYGAGMRTVDFQTHSAQVVDQVNGWVSTETNGLIPQIVTPDMITSATRLVLANALYLKGAWASPFDTQGTAKQRFTTGDGGAVEVDMMHQSLMTDWHAAAAWRATALRLKEPSLAMALILPTDPAATRIGDLLGGDGLAQIFSGTANVQLSMPKWRMRLNRQLKPALTAMGMPTPFDPGRADFSGMTTQERLFVSFVVHEAVVNVDEAGWEAAAATVGGMAGTSAPVDTQVLQLNRPFFYVIVHVPTQTPLFVGRVEDPTLG